MKKSWVVFLLMILISIQLFSDKEDVLRFYEEGLKHFKYGYYVDAVNDFKMSIKHSPNYAESYYWLAKSYVALQKFDLAYEELGKYIHMGTSVKIKNAKAIMKIIEKDVTFGDSVQVYRDLGYLPFNSVESDYAPVVADNGKTVYFTSQRKNGLEKENIWKVTSINDFWLKPELVEELSTDENESLGSLSEDGKTAYLFGNYKGDAKKGDIFTSSLMLNGEWEIPQRLTGINSKFSELQPYVFDDKVMFFTAKLPTSVGGTDIYVSEKVGSSWTKPINLGHMINTEGYEQTPFLDWDGKTLYFASNGHQGLGGFDIFRAEKIGSEWTEWSRPENVGTIVNSVRDDRYYSRGKNSNIVYISSNRVGGNGFEDIYNFNFDKMNMRKRVCHVVKGYVKDQFAEPVVTEFEWNYDIEDYTAKMMVETDENGYYEAEFPCAENYYYEINEKGYMITKGHVKPGDKKEVMFDIMVNKLEEKEPIIIPNILFEISKATLLESSYPILEVVAETLKDNPEIKVEISGHTCNLGSDDFNLNLSEDRAQTVVNFLIDNGINPERLISKGYGESKPIKSNETEDGRIENRRVEMTVIESEE